MPLLDLKYIVAHTYSHTSQVYVGMRRDSWVDRFHYCQGLCTFPGFTQCRVCAALLAIWVSDVFFLVNSSFSWECRWCAENFHKKLLPFLAERFVAKIAFHRHGCFQQRVLSSNHVQNCLIWSWKTTLWSISFSIDETLNDSGYLRRVSDHECLHIRQSVREVLRRIHAYDTAQLKKLLERTLEVTCLNKFAQCVATNQKPRLLGMANLEVTWNEWICYMLKYGVIPFLSNFKKSTSQSVPRFATLNMGSQKGIESKTRFAIRLFEKMLHPNVCFFSRL